MEDFTSVSIAGFFDSAVDVLDLSDPRLPNSLDNVALDEDDGAWRATVAPADTTGEVIFTPVRLLAHEYDQYQEMVGARRLSSMERLMRHPLFPDMTPQEQLKKLKEAYSHGLDKAKKDFMMELVFTVL